MSGGFVWKFLGAWDGSPTQETGLPRTSGPSGRDLGAALKLSLWKLSWLTGPADSSSASGRGRASALLKRAGGHGLRGNASGASSVRRTLSSRLLFAASFK